MRNIQGVSEGIEGQPTHSKYQTVFKTAQSTLEDEGQIQKRQRRKHLFEERRQKTKKKSQSRNYSLSRIKMIAAEHNQLVHNLTHWNSENGSKLNLPRKRCKIFDRKYLCGYDEKKRARRKPIYDAAYLSKQPQLLTSSHSLAKEEHNILNNLQLQWRYSHSKENQAAFCNLPSLGDKHPYDVNEANNYLGVNQFSTTHFKPKSPNYSKHLNPAQLKIKKGSQSELAQMLTKEQAQLRKHHLLNSKRLVNSKLNSNYIESIIHCEKSPSQRNGSSPDDENCSIYRYFDLKKENPSIERISYRNVEIPNNNAEQASDDELNSHHIIFEIERRQSIREQLDPLAKNGPSEVERGKQNEPHLDSGTSKKMNRIFSMLLLLLSGLLLLLQIVH